MTAIDALPLTTSTLRELRRATLITFLSPIDSQGLISQVNITATREGPGAVHRFDLGLFPASAAYSGQGKWGYCDRHAGGSARASLRNYGALIPTTLGSILLSLKQGDTLHVEWREGGNTNPVTEGHGLICDQLVLRVHRPQKGGRPDLILMFELDSVTTTPDSLSRWFHAK